MISFILVILALLNATPCALIRTKGFIQPIAFSLYRSCVNRIDTNEVSSEMSRKDDDIIDGKTNNASKKKIKVLCLHGYLVSADVFAFQLRHLVDGTVRCRFLNEYLFHINHPHKTMIYRAILLITSS